ncbi:MAG: DUF2029 domain-containing protein [Chloroflexota bacterium]|nr:hypothetical protein [Chloroflexota bacterium]MDE3102613.1 DUF2029 domain-containing protein [Chloroflexota bacterium]
MLGSGEYARTWRIVAQVVPFAVVAAALTAVVDPRRNDFFQFWYAGHLVVSGASPYDQPAWTGASAYGAMAASVVRHCPTPDAPACLWLYPPWTAWLFAPLGLLPPPAGIVGVEIVSILSLLAGIGAATLLFVPGAKMRAVAAPVFLASAPAVRDAATGHFDGFMLVGVVLLAIALSRARAVPLAAAVVLLSLKPHLTLVLAVVVAGMLVRSRSWRLLGAAVATCAVLLSVGATLDRRWLAATVGDAAAKVATSGNSSPLASGALWEIPLVLASAALAAIAVRRSPLFERSATIVAAATAVSLAAAPYLQSYDNVLLVPSFAVTAARRGPTGYAALAALLVGGWIVYVLELSGRGGYAPVLVLVALGALAARTRHQAALDRP